MKIVIKVSILLAVALATAQNVMAECGIKKGSIRILSNDFPALHAVVSEAEKCAGGDVSFTKNHTKENKDIQVSALKNSPAQYTAAIVANGTLVPLLNEGLIRPLDKLVAKYGKGLKKNQLITIDGKVMAVAFMANAQHLFYREDILKKAGVGVPKTYEDMLKAAKVIKSKKLVKYPLSGTYKAGWNLAEEFINMYMGYQGSLFKPGSAEPSINNKKGVATLKMMKALSEYMNPDFLTLDSNAVQAEWEAGNVALVNLWGSRYNAVADDEGSTPKVVSNTKVASAPSVAGNSVAASTLWWDGFVIAKNISDEDAEATFRALVYGISTEMANNNADKAAWVIPGFKAGSGSKGIIDTVSNKAKPYPMLPYIGLLHSALGTEIVDYFQGKESAQKALMDVESAYKNAAKEKGFL